MDSIFRDTTTTTKTVDCYTKDRAIINTIYSELRKLSEQFKVNIIPTVTYRGAIEISIGWIARGKCYNRDITISETQISNSIIDIDLYVIREFKNDITKSFEGDGS